MNEGREKYTSKKREKNQLVNEICLVAVERKYRKCQCEWETEVSASMNWMIE